MVPNFLLVHRSSVSSMSELLWMKVASLNSSPRLRPNLFPPGLANPGEAYTIFFGERAPWWVKISATGPTGHGSRFIPRLVDAAELN